MSLDEIIKMFKTTLCYLKKMPTRGDKKCQETAQNNEHQLVFPIYRKVEENTFQRRVSEQEARFTFVMLLYDRKIPFSVEVPTDTIFKFGKSIKDIKIDADGRSASHDLVFYPAVKESICVEFKAGGKADVHSIAKDIFKLAHCNHDQKFFFHIIDNADRGTFQSLNSKFKRALNCAECDDGTINGINILVAVVGKNTDGNNIPPDFFKYDIDREQLIVA